MLTVVCRRDDFADAIVDEKISISNYRLSASVACGKVITLVLIALVIYAKIPVSVLLCFGRSLGRFIDRLLDYSCGFHSAIFSHSFPGFQHPYNQSYLITIQKRSVIALLV